MTSVLIVEDQRMPRENNPPRLPSLPPTRSVE